MSGSQMSFSVVLEAVTAAFNKAILDAKNNYKGFTDGVGKDSDNAKTKTEGAGKAIYDLLNIKSGGGLKTEIANITRELETFRSKSGAPAAEVERVTKAAQAQVAKLRSELGGIAPPAESALTSITNLGKGALAIAGVTLGMAALKGGIEQVVAATIKLEQITKQLEYVTGSTEKAGVEFEFVKKVANELGLELAGAATGYAKLAASTKGTAAEGEATRKVFIGVASAAAAMGLSADETNGAIMALSQIASKGKVTMEELRGQLGERLPGAMAIAARSMGVSTGELEKLVEAGLDASTFLKGFGPAMIEAFGPSAAANAKTLQGSINLLRNQFFLMLTDLGKGGIGEAVSTVLSDLGAAIGIVNTTLKEMDPATVNAVREAFTQMYGVVSATIKALFTGISEVATILNSVADLVTDVSGAFTGIDTASDKVGFLTRTLQGLSITVGLFKDGISAIGIGFQVVTGFVQTFFASIATNLSKVTFGDLSKQLADLGKNLQAQAAESFGRAEKSAQSFQSAAGAALDATVSAANRAGTGVAAGIQAGTNSAGSAVQGFAAGSSQALGQMGAAAGAAGTAVGKVGAEAQSSFRRAEIAADSATTVIRSSSGAVLEVGAVMSKVGTAAADAFRDIAKEVGINIPPAAKSVEDLGLVMGTVAAKTEKTASDIGRTIPEALAKLSGAELQQFRTAFVGGLDAAGASARTMGSLLTDLDAAAAKVLGVNMAQSLTFTSKAFQDNRLILDGFIKDFDRLQSQGVNTTKLIGDSLTAMLSKASNPAELTQLIELFKKMGAEGKISGQQAAEGIQAAKDKIDQLTPGINSVAEAFKTFGLKTREESALTAAKYKEAFDIIKNSGTASTADLKTAFTAWATAAIAASGGVVTEAVKLNAAMLGLNVTVGKTGEVTVTAMNAGQASTEKLTGAARDLNKAYNDRMELLELSRTISTDYSERQISLLEQEMDLQERLLQLERDRLNVDKEGFTKDKSGGRLEAGGQTWISIMNTLKSYGVNDDGAARRIASEFTDSKGDVPYFSNPGQIKYGQSAGTLSMAIQKAAQQYLMTDPSASGATVGTMGGNSGRQIIEFKTPNGAVATVATSGSSTVEDVMAVLKNAGAVVSTR